MRYAIVTNPVSGKMTIDEKRAALAGAAAVLDAEVHGLDTNTPQGLAQCAREIVSRCDIVVIAGGDGTFSDIINSIDTAHVPVAYLPLGSGNGMRYALRYRGGLSEIAMRIREGDIHEYDLIGCDGKRSALMVSMGIEGTILRLREKYLAQGSRGFRTYLRAAICAYFREYKRSLATITFDDKTFRGQDLLSLLVVKQPYYGYRMNVVPGARFDDHKLHILWINSGLLKSIIGVATAFTIGNRVGEYHTAQRLAVKLERSLTLQVDGNRAWESDAFTFTILPKALKIKC